MGYGGMGYGGMGYGGMGYGTGYGDAQPTKGMMAIERFSMIVNSLCFTAEIIEHSMHSMSVFWEALMRIKSWAGSGFIGILKIIRRKFRGMWNLIMYILGRKKYKDECKETAAAYCDSFHTHPTAKIPVARIQSNGSR
jgi:hypothetical protein